MTADGTIFLNVNITEFFRVQRKLKKSIKQHVLL